MNTSPGYEIRASLILRLSKDLIPMLFYQSIKFLPIKSFPQLLYYNMRLIIILFYHFNYL